MKALKQKYPQSKEQEEDVQRKGKTNQKETESSQEILKEQEKREWQEENQLKINLKENTLSKNQKENQKRLMHYLDLNRKDKKGMNTRMEILFRKDS